MKAACCRKVGEACGEMERVSMGIRAWEAAKTAFIVAMYCAGSESETEMTRILACRVGFWGAVGVAVDGLAGSEDCFGAA